MTRNDRAQAHNNYVTPDNLLARISIHSYATHPNWHGWLFEHETPHDPGPARILDIGCGTGELWAANRGNINPSWILTLSDSSKAMLSTAEVAVGPTATYVVADIQALPFDDESFEIVVANHMLYHIADRPRAFSEVSRVLAPGGTFHCSTNGHGHLAQLEALVPGWAALATHSKEFGLETGPSQLSAFFTDIQVSRLETSLRVPSPEPVIAYIKSSDRYSDDLDLEKARSTIEAEIHKTGAFHISTHPGVITCRKP